MLFLRHRIIITLLILSGIAGVSARDGMSFYSDIDDAGNALANSLTSRALQDYSSFRNFWKNCRPSSPWLDTEPMSEKTLQEVTQGNYASIVAIANRKNITLTTDGLQGIASCLSETYANIQSQSLRQQEVLETAGNISIYNDGNRDNSDYDIIDDIKKIHTIIFSVPPKYDGVVNPTGKSLDKYLRGDPAPVLMNPDQSGTPNTQTDGTGSTGSTGSGSSGANNNGVTEDTPPWAATCSPSGSGSSSVSNMVNADFIADLGNVLGGTNTNTQGYDYGTRTGRNSTSGTGNASETAEKDYFHKPKCSGFFCITVSMAWWSQKLLVWGQDTSIQGILEAHINMIEPVSWTDLSGQKMTQNSFQIPFLNIKFANKIAGARVYMHNSPQISKRFQEEETQVKKDAKFDSAYRCALIDQGLSLNELQSAGVLGAGYILKEHTTDTIQNASLPLNAIDKERLQTANQCQELYREVSRSRTADAFSQQVGEIQAFTSAITDVITQILDTELRLDAVPVQ